jgi:hypothetical protein
MDDAAVVARLVCRDRRLPLEDGDSETRPAAQELERRGESNDAGADDADVVRSR